MKSKKSEQLSDATVKRATVLVVDDDPDIVRITQMNLAQEGFEVWEARSGVQCMEITKRNLPDVILLDLMMPEMDGFETCKRLKSVDATRDIPVIIVTALEDISDKLRCFSFKADDYVVKPYRFEELLARVYLHLSRASDLKEREKNRREIVLRDVLREISEGVGPHYHSIQEALAKAPAAGPVAAIRDASEAIIRIVESIRQREDPFYESDLVESECDEEPADEDDDLETILESLPEPPKRSQDD